MSTREEEIYYICDLLYKNFNVSIAMSNGINTIREYNQYQQENPTIDKNKIQKLIFKKINNISDSPIILSLNKLEYYISLYLKDNNKLFHIVLGPFLLKKIESKELSIFINRFKISFEKKDTLHNYLCSLPTYNLEKARSIGQLIYYLFNNSVIDLSNIKVDSDNDNFSKYMSISRSQEVFHHDNFHEKTVCTFIRNGQYEELKKFLSISPPLEDVGTVSNNPVRNEKNLAITAVALASRAAIEGGLHTEIAYSLSDMYIKRIEGYNDLVNFRPISQEIFLKYANQVLIVKKQNYSKSVLEVQQYIYNNLYKKLSLKILAEYVHLNSNYLSSIFIKEVGISISEYILIEKVNESKNWLKNSRLLISDIAIQLNFYDQSHYNHVFKKMVGITPKKFRDQVGRV